ncbi:hypothetical protein [Rhodococcus sp. ZPP]|uniref:hypothetical protein n=1 Tax=Rhodococcus sp. ZPP TaxID=2749906 RepID=UPI001FCDB394|nr:hypothetical protein [Rhodococcus sp. ZPP]
MLRRDLQIPPRILGIFRRLRARHIAGLWVLAALLVSAIDGVAATGTTVHSLLAVPVAVAR